MRSILLFLLILTHFSLPRAFANLCVNELGGRKPYFEFIDHSLEMGQADKFYLGSGYHADVFLHFDKAQNAWKVLKKYAAIKESGRVVSPEEFIESDIAAADLLYKMRDQHPFKVVTYSRHREDSSVVELDYHAGITLEQVLNNERLGDEIKKSLIFTFENGVQKLKNEFEKRHAEVKFFKYPNRFNEAIMMNTLQAEIMTVSGKKVNVWIKPDNIIVDPYTLELFLIDPH